MQETFLHAFAAQAKYEIRAPKAYLLRIAKNLALNEISRLSRISTVYVEDSDDPMVLKDDNAISAEKRLADKEALYAFAQAIAALPEKWRRVFVLRKMEQLSYKEISSRLGVPISTAEKYVAASVLQCEDTLRRQGHDPDDIRTRLVERKRRQSSDPNSVDGVTPLKKARSASPTDSDTNE